ncbi:signal peptidase I [Parasporobacterium paucivorans]|uniref:Signal peptidase I n=1 Tax=Parasporobacterium paucivorans DSM 15970 TaxID=1122934 RepID=A0A1M6HMV7_9FIRM|nr:signal peptidase I [Parasporobacterium paucivorans]SHJ23522.1 signal peptidase I . Serine peptidase. MEROPS family S26A [Parasporobacterium paucivorans DSM 15970]
MLPEEFSDNKITKSNKKKELLSFIRMIVIAFLIALFINNFILINATVPSGSMEKTIMTGSRMIGLRLTYMFGQPERGDIVIFQYPDDESQNFVKRVIGLPGETVEIRDGLVYIDGSEVPLNEPYLKETPIGSYGPYEVPKDCYFMMGDNRNDSLDSRFWKNKYVSDDRILGKALLVYWPKPSVLH